MQKTRSFDFCQDGGGNKTPYTLNMYKHRNIFSIIGNGDLSATYEELLWEEILNDGLAQALESLFMNNPKMLTRNAQYIRGLNFSIHGIKGQEMADKFFDTAVEHFSKYTNAYSFTRLSIKWEEAPEWAKYWVAMPKYKAVFSDQKPILNEDQSAWEFPKDSLQVEAHNMHYVGDWRKLIAERTEKPYGIVMFKGFKASHYRDEYLNEITYEEALEDNVIINAENAKFFESLHSVIRIEVVS